MRRTLLLRKKHATIRRSYGMESDQIRDRDEGELTRIEAKLRDTGDTGNTGEKERKRKEGDGERGRGGRIE